MSDNSHIEWTEATWNPVTGCSLASPGCTNCYAMKLAGTRLRHHPSRAGLTRESKAGPVWTGEVRLNEEWLTQPLRWKRPRRIFVCAHGDLFHESVPDAWIDRVFAVMALAPQHTFQVLTKRAKRMREYLSALADAWDGNADLFNERMLAAMDANYAWLDEEQGIDDINWPLPNVWLGVSVEDQTRSDERIPDLLATPAAVRWLSCEPLLGPVDLHDWIVRSQNGFGPPLDWIVAGGESGPGARPMHPDWARALRDQCAAAGVPFFFKQWGEWCPSQGTDCDVGRWSSEEVRYDGFVWRGAMCDAEVPFYDTMNRVGKKRSGRLLDGIEHNAYPS